MLPNLHSYLYPFKLCWRSVSLFSQIGKITTVTKLLNKQNLSHKFLGNKTISDLNYKYVMVFIFTPYYNNLQEVVHKMLNFNEESNLHPLKSLLAKSKRLIASNWVCNNQQDFKLLSHLNVLICYLREVHQIIPVILPVLMCFRLMKIDLNVF